MIRIKFVLIAGLEKMWNKLLASELIACFCLAIFFAGCFSLPEGTPPEGEIVKISVDKNEMTLLEADEYLATALMSYLFENNINNFRVDCSKNCVHICRKLKTFINLKITAENSDYYLELKDMNGEKQRILSLYDKKSSELLWQEIIKIK